MKNNMLFLGVVLIMMNTAGCSTINLSCAGRLIDDAYQNEQANELVKNAVKGNNREVKALVEQGANVNHLEPDTVPMLLWTLCAGSKKGFEILLEEGADPNLAGTGHGGGSGLGDYISSSGSIIEEGWSATLMAAATPDPDYLRLALKYGGDPNAHKGVHPNAKPLVIAANHGYFDNVKILVASGADVNVHHHDYEGFSAPVAAIDIRGRYDIAVWLLEHGYTHSLSYLAKAADGSYVPLDSPRQHWKEKLIDMLRERGLTFPANPGLKYDISKRIIPESDMEDIIMGRKLYHHYPLKQREKYHWESKEEYEVNLKKEQQASDNKAKE